MRHPSLTPYLDEFDRRKKQFCMDLSESEEPMPEPSELDLYFLGVAEKHGFNLAEHEDDYTGEE